MSCRMTICGRKIAICIVGLIIIASLCISNIFWREGSHRAMHTLQSSLMFSPSIHPSVLVIDTEAQDMDRSVPSFPCYAAKLANRSIPCCTYVPSQDWLSGMIYKGKYFLYREIFDMLSLLKVDERFQFIDIGANLGIYTLAVAHVGRDVLAVEPSGETVRRLRRSIFLGDTSRYVTLVNNALSDDHVELSMGRQIGNNAKSWLLDKNNCTEADPRKCVSNSINTITLDDLLPLMKSDRAIMKVDIEGHEIKVFNAATAAKFFDKIQLPFILLEWHYYRRQYKNPAARKKIDDWLLFFYERNYTVHHQDTGAELGKDCSQWSYDVIFKKPYENRGLL